MTDAFALFDEPRRPWLDPDMLKAKFLALSSEAHPDRVHRAPEAEKLAATQRFADLNAAYQRLRDPKDRLQLLLELELGRKPDQVRPINADDMSLFTEVSQLCRNADDLLNEQAGRNSPLLKIQFLERGDEMTARLNALQSRLNRRRGNLEGELLTLNPYWETASPSGSPERISSLPLGRLEQMLQDFSYLRRWSQQIQDRLIRLSCLP